MFFRGRGLVKNTLTVVKVEIFFATLRFLYFFGNGSAFFVMTLNSVIPMRDITIMTIVKVELQILYRRATLRYDYWYWLHLPRGSPT